MRITEAQLRRIVREITDEKGRTQLSGANTWADAVSQIKGQGAFMQRQQGPEGADDISLGKRIQLGPSKVTAWQILPGGRRKPKEIISGKTLSNKPVSWLLGYMFKNGASRVGPQEGPVSNPAFEYNDKMHKNYVYYTPTGFIQVDNVSDPVREKIFNMFRNAQLNAKQQFYVEFYDGVESGDIKLGDTVPASQAPASPSQTSTAVGLAPTSAVSEPERARPTDVRKILSDAAEKKIATIIRILSKTKPHEVEFYKRLVTKIDNALKAIHVNNPEEVRKAPLDVLKNVDANLFQTTLKQMGLPSIFEKLGIGKDSYKLANWTPEEFQSLREQFVGPRV